MDAIVTNIINGINIARKNILLYPSGHDVVSKSAHMALELLKQLLKKQQRVNLSIVANQLAVNESPFSRPTKSIKEMADTLIHHDISVVIFKRGITKKEFESFLDVLSTDREERVHLKNSAHIEVRYINLQGLALARTTSTKKDDQGAVTSRDSAARTPSHGSTSLGRSGGRFSFDRPRQLAEALEQRPSAVKPVMAAYEKKLTRHIHSPPPKDESISEAEAVPRKEQTGDLHSLETFLNTLSPALRKQFLSKTYDTFSQSENEGEIERTLGKLEKNLIIEMLQQADREKREISPSLFTVVNKLVGTLDGASSNIFQEGSDSAPGLDDEQLQNMIKLFDREKYEDYINQEYNDSLKGIVERAKAVTIEEFDLELYSATLGAKPTQDAVVEMLLSLMRQNDHDEEEYEAYSNVLISSIDRLLDQGAYSLLFRCYGTFSLLTRKEDNPALCAIGSSGVKLMEGKRFLAKLLNKAEFEDDKIQRKIRRMIMAMSSDAIKSIISNYATQSRPTEKRFAADLITSSQLRKQVITEIKATYLAHSSHKQVYNIVELLKFMAPSDAVPLLKETLKHKNSKISLVSFETLVMFKDREAIAKLSKCLESEDIPTVLQCIDMAGKLRVKALNSKLVEMVQLKALSTIVHTKNVRLLNALGGIGDSASIPLLKRIIHGNRWLFPNRQAEMKFAAYKAAGGIPRKFSMELLQYGVKSKNKDIRKLCQNFVDGR